MRSIGYRIAIGILGLVVDACLVAISQAYLARYRAEQFLLVLKQVQVGTTDHDTVVKLTEPFRKNRIEYDEGDVRVLHFSFDNGLFSLTRLVPYTFFNASVAFRDGIVLDKSAVQFTFCCIARIEESRHVPSAQRAGRPNHIVSGIPPQPGMQAVRILVFDDTSYGQRLRDKDWEFDLSCFTRVGGCKDARMMLPNAVATDNELQK